MPADNSQHIIPDLQKLPDGTLLTRRQLAEISSFKLVTLKLWAKQGRGPKITRVENRPRYRAQDVREWMAAG
jgi:predicted site-specific integrase-resolvase